MTVAVGATVAFTVAVAVAGIGVAVGTGLAVGEGGTLVAVGKTLVVWVGIADTATWTIEAPWVGVVFVATVRARVAAGPVVPAAAGVGVTLSAQAPSKTNILLKTRIKANVG